MLKNKIQYYLDKEERSIRWLSRKIGFTYAATHSAVNREDLSTTQLGTVVKIAKVLKVEVTDLYEDTEE